MTQYFRVTAYDPGEGLSAIFDSNGLYKNVWQLGSYLIGRGFEILEISTDEQFIDVNVGKVEPDPAHILLRGHCRGKSAELSKEVGGSVYRAIRVGDGIYIPDKSKTGGAV
ncbi:hypothetical protein FACS1894211_16150 [Clostridia bacterium]|nr:hypothetical protein FACS1894211_16150 [Clostridia bacterium]